MSGCMPRGPLCQETKPVAVSDGTNCRAASVPPRPSGTAATAISTYYPQIHPDGEAGTRLAAIPEDDKKLKIHYSVQKEEKLLFGLLKELRDSPPEYYYGEIYSKVLKPGPMRANYISAALNTAHTPVDNKTRYALQLFLVRHVITYGRDFARYKLGEFSYALHEKAFRWAGKRSTIGMLPWAVLEFVDIPNIANFDDLPISDWLIVTTIEQLNPPSGDVSELGFLIRQYIDYTSELWAPYLPE